MEDLTGKRLGPYQVLAPLGEGGMAAVYKAFQPGVERNVALKILPRHLAKDAEFVARFEREARVLARLQHPHILPVFDYGEEDGYTYIVMPLVKSGTLSQLLKGQPLPLHQVEKIIAQLGDALDYAHTHGIVHRDVKPSNVLIDERGNCLLTDFGIAKLVQGSDNKLTGTGGLIGTPAYMSPEQGRGVTIDGRSDIYSLGIILYELTTGRVPFKAETPLAVMVKHLNDPLPPPRNLNPNLPDRIEQVILKALAKNPADRYAAAADMIQALQAAIRSQSQQDPVFSLPDTFEAATLRHDPGAVQTADQADFTPTVASGTASSPVTGDRRPWLKWTYGAAGLAIIALLAFGGWWGFSGQAGNSQSESTPLALIQVTAGLSPTNTPLPTNTPVPTNTPAPTNTPVPTNTPLPTNTPTPTPTALPTNTPTPVPETEFPLPDSVRNFIKAANSEQILFETDLTVDELLEFYRQAFTQQGLTERELLTTIFDGGFSIVFDGAPNGLATVVQVTDLGKSTPTDARTVVIRYEAV